MVETQVAPPEIPDYVQPPCPGDGYLWTPGYWAWAPMGYYWVPGVWVRPPHIGLLWTPGYWGFYSGHYGWHRGYWGPNVGFYGGVNYGYGYGGFGFYGGRWEGRVFRYNTAVWHVNERYVHNTYREEIKNGGGSRASYNGPGRARGRPGEHEMGAMHENHVQPTSRQQSHHQAPAVDSRQFSNNGRPSTATMNKINGQHFNHEGHAAPSFHGGGNRGGGNNGGRSGGGNHGGGGGHR